MARVTDLCNWADPDDLARAVAYAAEQRRPDLGKFTVFWGEVSGLSLYASRSALEKPELFETIPAEKVTRALQDRRGRGYGQDLVDLIGVYLGRPQEPGDWSREDD